VCVDVVAQATGGARDRALERGIGERLDLAAVLADDVVVMIAARRRGLEPGDPVADVDALDETELCEHLEHAVDRRDSHRPAAGTKARVDLLCTRAAVLAGHQVENGGARPAGTEACLAQGVLGVLAPGADGCHPEDDSDSHRRARVPGVKTRIVLTLIAVVTLVGCGGDSQSDKTTVVAAFYPLAFAAQEIGGAGVSVTNLTPPGVEPHDLELSAGDIQRIGDADVVLYLGSGFQAGLEKAIDSTSANAVDLLAVVKTRKRGDEHGVDPHVWLDPIRYAAIAERIGNALGRPTEARGFADRLRALDRDFRRGLASCDHHEIVTSHAAFGYLAGRYGLKQVAITGLSPEAEPTPRDLEQVVDEVRAVGATTVFFETLISPRLAETVAREVGAQTAVLDPIEGLTEKEASAGEDYFSVMRENLAALRKALGCR
jgi:zinc transport system substrate-binding protein